MSPVVIIVLILLLCSGGGIAWRYGGPFGGLGLGGLLLLIVAVYLLTGGTFR